MVAHGAGTHACGALTADGRQPISPIGSGYYLSPSKKKRESDRCCLAALGSIFRDPPRNDSLHLLLAKEAPRQLPGATDGQLLLLIDRVGHRLPKLLRLPLPKLEDLLIYLPDLAMPLFLRPAGWDFAEQPPFDLQTPLPSR